MNTQFNYTPYSPEDVGRVGLVKVIAGVVAYVNGQMKLLARAMRGPVVVDAGDSGTAKTVTLQVADINELRLTDNVTLTLGIRDTRKGMAGDIEFQQDATGGRVVTFVNLVGSTPAITATASKRTLVRFVHVGDGWIAQVVQSNY